jgi:lysozyme
MKTGKHGLDLIKHFERCRLKAFKPILSDPWTIGWGRTRGVNAGDECTQAEADAWLVQDVFTAEKAVALGTQVPLSQNQFDALVSFEYNTGGYGMSTLRKLVNVGDFMLAAAEFPRWNKSKGMILAGLTKRRADERRLFETPDGQHFEVTR